MTSALFGRLAGAQVPAFALLCRPESDGDQVEILLGVPEVARSLAELRLAPTAHPTAMSCWRWCRTGRSPTEGCAAPAAGRIWTPTGSTTTRPRSAGS